MQLKINEEYARLVPPLPKPDYEELKESIEKDGLYYPITINEKGEILDGHHRFQICSELGIEPETDIKKFDNLKNEKKFVIKSNFNRRHLEIYQRAALANELHKLEGNITFPKTLGNVKKRDYKKENKNRKPKKPKDERKGNESRQRAAKTSHLSDETLRKYQYVLEHGSPELIEEMTNGWISIDKAYNACKRHEAQRLLSSKTVIKTPKGTYPDLRQGDFNKMLEDLEDDFIDVVLTDPPYAPEDLELYGQLAKLADRVLKPGGSLVTYCGSYNLPDVLQVDKKQQFT